MKPFSSRPLLSLLLAMVGLLPPAPITAQPPVTEDDAIIKTARIEDARPLGVGRPVPSLDLTTLKGDKLSLSALLKDRKGLVIAMTSATCPMCAKYSPRLAEMEDDLAPRGIGFAYINGQDVESPAEMSRQAQQYRMDGPYIPDPKHLAVNALGARTTTEVFLLNPAGVLVYRGAVDDQFGIGSTLDAPRNAFLKDAIDAMLAGLRPRVEATWAPGCLLDTAPVSRSEPGGSTYTGTIAWILADNCTACHRSGGAAPFALDTYEAVTGRAKMIEAVVRDGLMPPWHGAPHTSSAPSPWVNDRSLAEGDRTTLLAWLASDRPRGPDAPLPALPAISQTWTIGEPDLLVTTSGLRLPAQGGLHYGRVMVALPPASPGISVDQTRWISSLELRPVEAKSIHHALVWLLTPGDQLPDPNLMPTNLELIGTFSPGDNRLRYPPGIARRLPPGSIFIVDLYATPMGKEAISALRIAMKFGPEPKFGVKTVVTAAQRLDDSARAEAAIDLREGGRLLSLTPYMRSRGRSLAIRAESPSAAAVTLLDAPKYDFRWQVRYELVEPRELVPGTRLVAEGRFDPSDAPSGLGSAAHQESLLLAVELLVPLRDK